MRSGTRGLGRKPRRLYLRTVVVGPGSTVDRPTSRELSRWVAAFDRAGRLVAHGELTEPAGDLLIFRAEERGKAERLLRSDPWARVPGTVYQLSDWRPTEVGVGVAIEPPAARGSGRITRLQRVPVVVSDLSRAIDWYRDVLGMQVLESEPDAQYFELGLVPGSTALALIRPDPAWGEPYYSETRDRMGSVTGIVFQTDSVRALELRLRHAGATVTRSESVEPEGRKVVQFADPDGNEFLAFEAAPGTARDRRPPALLQSG
jgi:catechol 2,3-dioxygenase-like lactoylglutathione lyase family enzyme